MNLLNPRVTYDISILLGEAATYPGDRSYSSKMISNMEWGDSCNLSELALSAHSGTHLDGPRHFYEKGKTLDQYPMERFFLPAHVVLIEDENFVRPQELEGLDVRAGDAILFQTYNSRSGLSARGPFSKRFVYLTLEAAKLCLELGASLVGIDYFSVDRYGDNLFPVHCCLLEKDVLILEGINLDGVPPGKYYLFCPPLRLKDAEAAPARAILLR